MVTKGKPKKVDATVNTFCNYDFITKLQWSKRKSGKVTEQKPKKVDATVNTFCRYDLITKFQ
ncbi:hypothetical protein GCM10027442_45350 [Emticicia fontis]